VSDDAGRGRGRGADRTGTRLGAQDTRVTRGVFLCALTGWTLISMTHGGIDPGRLPVGSAATALAWGLFGAAVLAAAASWTSRGLSWGRPAAIAITLLGGLVAWSAASVTWSPVPDLAWLTTNRIALALAALALGTCMSLGRPDAAQQLAIGLAVASVPILVWALGSRVIPEWLAPTLDTPRLAAPIGHANTLALVATVAVPGALLLAGTRRWRRHGALILMGAVLVVAMTGSRSGLIALVVCIGLAVWLQPKRAEMLAALGAGLAGAIPASVYALGAPALTAEPFLGDPATRRGTGLLLGALIVTGGAIGWVLFDVLLPPARRVERMLARPRAARVVVGVAAGVVALAVTLAVLAGRGAHSGAGRQLSLDSNHRTAWWGQAWRGFLDAPLIGQGSGSFPLTHFAERQVGVETLQTRQPHQLVLELMTELGLVGVALALAALGVIVWAAVRVGRRSGPAVAIVVPFVIQAQLDTPWTSPAAYVPALAAGGVILAMAAGQRTTQRGHVRSIVAGVVAVAACVSALVVWSGERRVSAAYVALGTNAGEAVRLASAAEDDLWPSIGPMLVQAKALMIADPVGARAAAERATRRQPDNPFAWECLAEVSDGASKATALDRWTRLDPKRDPAIPATCQPGW
jgi:O-Antigen ligase